MQFHLPNYWGSDSVVMCWYPWDTLRGIVVSMTHHVRDVLASHGGGHAIMHSINLQNRLEELVNIITIAEHIMALAEI